MFGRFRPLVLSFAIGVCIALPSLTAAEGQKLRPEQAVVDRIDGKQWSLLDQVSRGVIALVLALVLVRPAAAKAQNQSFYLSIKRLSDGSETSLPIGNDPIFVGNLSLADIKLKGSSLPAVVAKIFEHDGQVRLQYTQLYSRSDPSEPMVVLHPGEARQIEDVLLEVRRRPIQ